MNVDKIRPKSTLNSKITGEPYKNIKNMKNFNALDDFSVKKNLNKSINKFTKEIKIPPLNSNIKNDKTNFILKNKKLLQLITKTKSYIRQQKKTHNKYNIINNDYIIITLLRNIK
jgi:hypothetical protein